MYVNNKEKIDNIKLNKDNFYIVVDFDRTLSKGNSESTWGTFARAKIFDEEYNRLRAEQYAKYRPIEVDPTIDPKEKEKYMDLWWREHIELFDRFGLKESDIEICARKGGIDLRDGAIEFLKSLGISVRENESPSNNEDTKQDTNKQTNANSNNEDGDKAEQNTNNEDDRKQESYNNENQNNEE